MINADGVWACVFAPWPSIVLGFFVQQFRCHRTLFRGGPRGWRGSCGVVYVRRLGPTRAAMNLTLAYQPHLHACCSGSSIRGSCAPHRRSSLHLHGFERALIGKQAREESLARTGRKGGGDRDGALASCLYAGASWASLDQTGGWARPNCARHAMRAAPLVEARCGKLCSPLQQTKGQKIRVRLA